MEQFVAPLKTKQFPDWIFIIGPGRFLFKKYLGQKGNTLIALLEVKMHRAKVH